VVTGDYRLGDVRHVTASSARARDELGWSARIGFADGMAAFAAAPLRVGAGHHPRSTRPAATSSPAAAPGPGGACEPT
jgi:dTDP-L-rhamnose 4-epimerase